MAKGSAGGNAQKAMQQRIAGGMAIVTQGVVLSQPSKAELRAMVPEYEESSGQEDSAGRKGEAETEGVAGVLREQTVDDLPHSLGGFAVALLANTGVIVKASAPALGSTPEVILNRSIQR